MKKNTTTNIYCKFTEDLDKRLLNSFSKDDFTKSMYKSYLWAGDVENCLKGKDNIIAFRAPGATRGHLKVEKINSELIIREIVFYESTCFSHNIGCYKESVKELIPLYIGKVLEL